MTATTKSASGQAGGWTVPGADAPARLVAEPRAGLAAGSYVVIMPVSPYGGVGCKR
jgi:hypothetical protein